MSKKNGKIGVKTYIQFIDLYDDKYIYYILKIYIKHAYIGELNSAVHKNSYHNASTLKIHKGKR